MAPPGGWDKTGAFLDHEQLRKEMPITVQPQLHLQQPKKGLMFRLSYVTSSTYILPKKLTHNVLFPGC